MRAAGAAFEALAATHLERSGFRILHRNYTIRAGEIDLVALAPDGTVCFVEVRARAGTDFGTPAETVGAQKRRRIASAAALYLARHYRGREPACRFDVVAITGDQIEHITDAFRLGD
jgi:putative endonuclease